MDFIVDFATERNVELEESIVSDLVEWAVEVPVEYMPDWDSGYVWKLLGSYKVSSVNRNYLAIFYFPNTFDMVICELET